MEGIGRQLCLMVKHFSGMDVGPVLVDCSPVFAVFEL